MPKQRASVNNILVLIQLIETERSLEPGSLQQKFLDLLTLGDRVDPFDFGDEFMNPTPRPQPTVGETSEGRGLFYTGKVNLLFGDDSSGKSLLTDVIAIQEVQKGHGVLILECEESDVSSRVERWVQMSDNRTLITQEQARRLTVWPVTHVVSTDQLNAYIDRIMQQDVTLVVIDSLSDLMGKYGLNENDAGDVRRIETELLKPLAACGTAVVVIDHVSKSSDGKSARGSIVKRNLISGIAYQLFMPEGHEFCRVAEGFSVLTVRKDRLGNYERHKSLAVMHVLPADLNGGLLTVTIDDDTTMDIDNLENGEPFVDNRQEARSVATLINELEIRMQDMPMTARTVKTFMDIPTLKAAQELLDAGVEEGRWMYSRGVGAYVLPQRQESF